MTTATPIIIFDTTLRDGEQSPGATMSMPEKMAIAEALDQMGVDVIEAGFAIASPGDFQCVEEIAKKIKNATVCSLARAKMPDIEAAGRALKPAKNPRIHTFISTSPIHMEHQFKMTQGQVLTAITESVKYARQFCHDVEWSAMDATRSEIDFLARAVETAIKAGATTINLPDTVGYILPHEYAEMIRTLRQKVPNIDKAIISTHCHNDLGLAVANSLAAIEAGARQVECTVNGIGERAGNAALEEIVMAIKTRKDKLNYDTKIKTPHIARVSKLVATASGFSVQKNKAIVGANAFAHESGIHQDGMLKSRDTYEIMTPESVGIIKSELVMGKHSGRAAFRDKLQALGLALENENFEKAFARFKELGDRKKHILDEDIIALIDEQSFYVKSKFEFSSFHISGHSKGEPDATVTLKIDDEEKTTHAVGDGPLDAIFSGINQLTQQNPVLETFDVHAVTAGPDAQAEASVVLKHEERIFSGSGRDTDTLVASTKAYIHAINKIYNFQRQNADQTIPSKESNVGIIWMDGKFIPEQEAQTHIMTHGLHYASAVFEGMRAYNGKVFKLQEHHERMHASAEKLGFKIPYTVDELNKIVQELLQKNNLKDAYVRPIAWCGAETLNVASKKCSVHVAIAVWEWHSYFNAEDLFTNGLKLTWSEWIRPAPNMAPVSAKASGLYVIGTLSKNKAEAAGYHDALMLDYRGYVAECTGSNFFMIKDNEIHTPIADCFLDGITRKTIIEIARNKNISVVERYIKPEEINNADEIFITGSAAEVAPVGQIDNDYFSVGPITKMLAEEYSRLVRK